MQDMKQRMELQDGYISSLQQRQDNQNPAQKDKTENEVLKRIKQLIKETPNDFELGNRIRNIFS